LAQQIQTSDPLTLVCLLYEGLLKEVRAARAAVRAGAIKQRSQHITRALGIVAELSGVLCDTPGSQIAPGLRRLYEHFVWQLTEANIHQQEGPLADLERLAGTLASAWRELQDAGSNGVLDSAGRRIEPNLPDSPSLAATG
jgi:flagellar protein FliS